jgi:multiple sugar transport system substrate-binding protein
MTARLAATAPGPGPSRRSLLLAVLAGTGALAAGCDRPSATDSAQERRKIVFATWGLGNERPATKSAIRKFEQQNPDIEVDIRFLDANSTRAFEQLARLFKGGAAPDLLTLDVIWPARFAQDGRLLGLDRFRPDMTRFVPAQVQAGTYDGQVFAIPWFINAEGLYYRTDLVPEPPRSPAEVVDFAHQAMRRDASLRSGFAFAGAQFEGLVTVFLNVVGGFGGQIDPMHLQTPETLAALTYLSDAVLHNGIAPAAVQQWQEQQVADEFLSGRAVFAMNWPYVFEHAERPGSKVRGKTGWIPFPAGDHAPTAALGGSMLAIAASSRQAEASWRLIDFLTSGPVQVERAVAAGDPPSLPSAYTDQLIARAPQFGRQRAVFQCVTPRPVVPNYLEVSALLQTMLSTVLAAKQTPPAALAATSIKLVAMKAGAGA